MIHTEIEHEIQTLQEQRTQLSTRLSSAQSDRTKAREAIVAGNEEAGADAAEAEQRITALQQAIGQVDGRINLHRRELAAMERRAQQEAQYDRLAEIGAPADAYRLEFEQLYSEACRVVTQAVVRMVDLVEKNEEMKRQFMESLAELAPNAWRPSEFDETRDSDRMLKRELDAQLREVQDALAARGLSLQDILSTWGRPSHQQHRSYVASLCPVHQFPSSPEIGDVVRSVFFQALKQRRQVSVSHGLASIPKSDEVPWQELKEQPQRTAEDMPGRRWDKAGGVAEEAEESL